MSVANNQKDNIGMKDVARTLVLTAALFVGGYYLSTPVLKVIGFGPSALEKSLVIGKSTVKDFQDFKDDGGLSKHKLFHDFWVTGISTNYGKNNVLQGYELHFSKGYSIGTVPSVNEIKKVFKKVCGEKWDAYLAKSDYGVMCLISDDGDVSSIRVHKVD